MDTSATITKIAPALLAAQRSMGDAVKDSKNPFFKSSYADLNAVREVAIPALNSVGISVLQPTIVIAGSPFVRTLLLHESGEYISSDTQVLSVKPNDPQAAGSGISYARRYGLQSLLNIGAVDDDAEAGMGRGAPAKASYPTKAAPPKLVKALDPVVETDVDMPKANPPTEVKKNTFKKPAKQEATSSAAVASASVAEPDWEG